MPMKEIDGNFSFCEYLRGYTINASNVNVIYLPMLVLRAQYELCEKDNMFMFMRERKTAQRNITFLYMILTAHLSKLNENKASYF